jgi:RecJ-like exonuclease
MGTCIVCGRDTDGRICSTHEEDVAFDFRGDNENQLIPGRFYRGSVDGFAEFGAFIDIGPVTGLLHRSEVPGRIESLDWGAGDEVFVQVTNVHDNGNIDLGWSIRQSEREFRGILVQDPSLPTNAELPEDDEEDADASQEDGEGNADTAVAPEGDDTPDQESTAEARREPATDGSQAPESGFEFGEDEAPGSAVAATEQRSEPDPSADAPEAEPEPEPDAKQEPEPEPDAKQEPEPEPEAGPEQVSVEYLPEHVGETVRLEGELVGVRQTSGPTVFDLADETATVDCAAFVEAGVRAYPDAEVGDLVRLVGEVERRRGELQVETAELTILTGDELEEVAARLDAAVDERASPETDDILVQDDAVELVQGGLVEAATEIRRAIVESRPVIIRHTADVDGYVAGSAIERAVLPLVRDEHAKQNAEYHYIDRQPVDGPFYDVDAATDDVTSMLEAAARHDEKHPLFVLVGTGSTRESVDGLDFLDLYDAPTVAIDGGYADGEAADAAGILVSPTQEGGDAVQTGVLGAHLAGLVNDNIRDDLAHLPAICFWEDVPAVYADLAGDVNYDRETLADLRDAIALEAFYQSYEDKRELIADLLWDETNESLAAHVGGQFRTKLDTEVATAEPHLTPRSEGAVDFEVLDVDAFTHRYDFPPVELLLDALYRRDDREADVLLGLDGDELRVRSETVDVRAAGERIADALPEAGVTPKGAQDGYIEFLRGAREDVLEAAIDAITDQLD